MRKLALFVALAMIAASPALAAPKKKAAAKQPEMADWQKQNDNSYRLARDSLPMWLPSWAQPIYHGRHQAARWKPTRSRWQQEEGQGQDRREDQLTFPITAAPCGPVSPPQRPWPAAGLFPATAVAAARA